MVSHFYACIRFTGSLAFMCVGAGMLGAARVEFLSDVPERLVSVTQGWGELGINLAAHQPGSPGNTLEIATRKYQKGLGHHAPGEIVVALDAEFESFDAEVGLQPCGGGGSVAFRVFVDGERRFDSGVVTARNSAKPVHVSLVGAQELRLVAGDAGDGITCDMANWADARLIASTNPTRLQQTQQRVDMAGFARVVTWDPNRSDGVRASRVEEFHSEDVFLERGLMRNTNGLYLAPATSNVACIGLQWLNQRALKEVALEFAEPRSTNGIKIEGWFGESAWQGGWKPLIGELRNNGERLVFQIKGMAPTRKVRWLISGASDPIAVTNLSAFTRSRWDVAALLLQVESARPGETGELQVINGEISQPLPLWQLANPLRLQVRYSRPSSFKSDPTILQVRLPTGSFGVAVEDVLSNGCVYVRDHRLFVSTAKRDSTTGSTAPEAAAITLSEYKARIAERKTILQEVRGLPEQTFSNAMARTHHEAQREGPVMLSLACDNAKYVVERDGTVRFHRPGEPVSGDWMATAARMQPRFSSGAVAGGITLRRELDGAWLPIPIITTERNGVLCRQRTFVAPTSMAGESNTFSDQRSVCVTEFSVTNSSPAEAEVSFWLEWRTEGGGAATVTASTDGYVVGNGTNVFAMITADTNGPLQPAASSGEFKLSGQLPAHGSYSVVAYIGEQRDWQQPPLVPRLREETERYWKAQLAGAMNVTTPEPILNDIIRSSPVRCLIAARNEAAGARVAPWIAAMSYGPLESEAHSVIRGMDLMGHDDFARRGLDFFIRRYNTNGFLTTGYTTFGTAWHLWTVGEHYAWTHDERWLRAHAAEFSRVAHWIIRQTEKTRRLHEDGTSSPEFGLMPPGVLADWNAFAYHFCLNAYYYAALRETGNALADLKDADATLFVAKADELRDAIRRAYLWTQAHSPVVPLRDGTWTPYYPSQVHSPGKLADFFPGQDAGRSWCYDVELGAHQLVPAGVFDPHEREVDRMLDHMEDVQFLADGWFDYPAATNQRDWFNLGGFSKVQPYYTRNAEIYAMRDDVKPFVRSYFNTIAAMLNPEVLTFWEHFHHSGAWDKTHETGYFLQQTRFMMVMEHGDELWVAPLVTSNWMRNGMSISATNAPTRFGKVSFEVHSHIEDGYIEALVKPPARRSPKAIVLRLRHPEGKPLRRVTVDGTEMRSFDARAETVRLVSPKHAVTVRGFF